MLGGKSDLSFDYSYPFETLLHWWELPQRSNFLHKDSLSCNKVMVLMAINPQHIILPAHNKTDKVVRSCTLCKHHHHNSKNGGDENYREKYFYTGSKWLLEHCSDKTYSHITALTVEPLTFPFPSYYLPCNKESKSRTCPVADVFFSAHSLMEKSARLLLIKSFQQRVTITCVHYYI